MASRDPKDLTQIIGDCGKFQVFLTMACHSATAVTVWGTMFMAYGAYNPGWICLDSNININVTKSHNDTTSTTKYNETKSVNSTEYSEDCDVRRKCENLMYNDETSTVATEWDLSCGSSWITDMMISIQMTGSLLGSYFSGQIGDRFGRKLSLYMHVAFHGICHVMATFSPSWQFYTTVLFFIGFGVGGIMVNSYPYPLEFANSWWRGVIVSIPVWNISFLLFVSVIYALRDWQQVHIVSAALSTLAFLPVFWTPESVRWLTVSGKVDKAKNVVEKISRFNKRQCPDTSIIDDIANEEETRMGDHTYTYIDLFRIPIIRGYSIKFGIIWFMMAYTLYGIAFGIRSLSGDFFLNLVISALLEIPGVCIVGPMINKLGRRISALIIFTSQVICCVTLVILFLMTSGSSKDMPVLILALFTKALGVAAFAVFSAYSSELYPTVIRSTHFGYLSAVAKIGLIVSPYLFLEDPAQLYVAFIVVGFIGTLNFVLVWTLPETKERMMIDTTESVANKQ